MPLLLLLLALLRAAQAATVCTTCSCSDAVISCTQLETLNLTRSFMSDGGSAESVDIRGCGQVTLHRDSFTELKHLHRLTVADAESVLFDWGVFDRLRVLALSNISSVAFREKAFMSAPLQELDLRHLTIDHLPQYAFFDLKNLTNVTFKDVHIASISKDAIALEMPEISQIIIQQSVLANVSSGGLVVSSVSNFIMQDTVVTSAEPAAVQISATGGAELSGCTLNDSLADSSVVLSAPSVRIVSNRMERTTCIAATTSNLSFRINSVENETLPAALSHLGWFNVSDVGVTVKVIKNRFYCSCEAQLRDELQHVSESGDRGAEVLVVNSCQPEFCGESVVSVGRLRQLLENPVQCDEAVQQQDCEEHVVPQPRGISTDTDQNPADPLSLEPDQSAGVGGLHTNTAVAVLITAVVTLHL